MEKTPSHVFHIEAILEAIPDARFVEITRDPRDVLASKKTRRETVWSTDRYAAHEREQKHLEKAYHPLWDALAWKSAISAGRQARARHPERTLRVRYEDLVTDAEGTVRGICQFLDLPFEPAMLDVSISNAADWNQRSEHKGIYTQSLGRWQKTLTPAEIALCETVLARELDELGHDRAEVGPWARVQAGELALRSAAHLVVRLHRRWRMGGTGFLQAVARDYARRAGVLLSDVRSRSVG